MLLKKIASYILLNAMLVGFWCGGIAWASTLPDGVGTGLAICVGLATGFGLLTFNRKLASYWRDRETERWVHAAFPSDSERDRQMRHDLIYGSDEFKEQDDSDRRPLTPLNGFYIYPESEADRERLRELRGAMEQERRRASR